MVSGGILIVVEELRLIIALFPSPNPISVDRYSKSGDFLSTVLFFNGEIVYAELVVCALASVAFDDVHKINRQRYQGRSKEFPADSPVYAGSLEAVRGDALVALGIASSSGIFFCHPHLLFLAPDGDCAVGVISGVNSLPVHAANGIVENILASPGVDVQKQINALFADALYSDADFVLIEGSELYHCNTPLSLISVLLIYQAARMFLPSYTRMALTLDCHSW